MPHSEDPEPPNAEPHDDASKAAEISDEEFHEHADRYLEALVAKVEEMQESREDLDIEYAVCVLLYPCPI